MIGMTVCSGIGAPEVAAPWVDWKYQSEIKPFPSAVLAHRFPDAVNLGDMTKFQEWPDATVDVLVGGTPCQGLSNNGLRRGFGDARSRLALDFLEIAERYRPAWLVWENVAGALRTNGGRDFGAFVGGLAKCGYWWAYRVLDAFDLGAALPRPRVFVVAGSRARIEKFTAAFFADRSDGAERGGGRPRGHTLSAQNAGSRNARGNIICEDGRLRGMSCVETERALGFPDNWTRIPYRNKPAEQCPDGPRYKALGNSMAINCMEFIFERLRWVDENFPMEAAE